jgi:PAS domain S-box-containing protein
MAQPRKHNTPMAKDTSLPANEAPGPRPHSPEQGCSPTQGVDLLEYQATVEQLRTAEEELREQNEELDEARFQLEKERTRYQQLFEFAPDAYLVLDANGTIRDANLAAARLLNYPAASLAGKPLLLFVPLEDRLAFRTRLTSLLDSDDTHEWEFRLLPRKRTPFDAGMTIAVERNPSRRAIALRCQLRKLTDRKRGERLAMLGEMAAVLAHESRNALQRSQGCIEQLCWRLQNRPDVQILLSRLQQSQDELTRLFDEVRGFTAPLQLERVPATLDAVWRQAWADLHPLHQHRDVSLEEDTAGVDLSFRIDLWRMRQVFRNLLENALTACTDPVQISIRVSETRLDARRALRVAICDNGPGLTEEQQQNLFEPFYTTKVKGTGLGGAVAKRLVEAHGGNVAVGGQPGPGAQIIITLPRGLQ